MANSQVNHTPSRGGSGVTSLALAGMNVAVKMTRNRPVRNDLWEKTAKDGRWGVSSSFFTACGWQSFLAVASYCHCPVSQVKKNAIIRMKVFYQSGNLEE